MHQYEPLKNGRPTIAVLVASMTSHFHEGLMKGAVEAAEEKGFNIIVYSGGPFNAPDPTAQSRETVFDLVDMNIIDGVIVPIGSHTRYMNHEERMKFLHRFSSVPIININGTIEGCTNITADFEPGLSQLMDHYINDHNYKRIAFFRGPGSHPSSDARAQMYRKQLIKHNIAVDEDLIIYSDLAKKSAQESVEELLDKRGKSCDAIIALNDHLALGIIETLNERGIQVPEDIAVSGTMNVPAGLFSVPPLTTIREPIFHMGKEAVYTLSELFDGKKCPSTIHLPTTLITRESCGCTTSEDKAYKRFFHRDLPELSSQRGELEPICLDILKKAKCSDDSTVLLSILEEYNKAKIEMEFTPFINALSKQMECVVKTETLMGWIMITSEIQLDLIRIPEGLNNFEPFKDTIVRLILLKDRIENKLVKLQKFEISYYNNFFRETLKLLNTSFDLRTIKESTIKILKISDFFISIYTQKDGHITNAENIMAVRNNQEIKIDEKDKLFPAKQLLPDNFSSFTERYSLIIFPLSFRKKPMGFLMVNTSYNNGSIYENIQVIISAALKNELQIQDLKNAEERFSDIAHSTSNWLWETDSSHQFTYCSLSVLDILGYEDEELTGQNIDSFSVSKGNTHFQSMVDQEIISDTECWFRHKNGNVMCLKISAKPIIKEGLFKGYRGIFKDITDQKLQNEKINHLAYYDVLTDLPNRALFQEKLDLIISKTIERHSNFALMFLDIDRFKFVNDSMGHASGDQMLIHVGVLLQKSIRSHDILARLGGDEFTIILPEIKNETQVISIAERIMKNLETPVMLKDKNFHVTMSLGIAMFPLDGGDSVSILKRADNAMYQAKSLGRNRYVFYDRDMEQKNARRKTNEENLYDALTNDRFILHYQPQVDAKSMEILGMEALVRIKNKQDGIISPNNFIDLAEELGLIGRIDEWVFSESCRQYTEWRSKGYESIRISVNISALQLRNKDLVKRYLKIIEKNNINPSNITLEITENALIANQDMALEILSDFKSNGLSIALDDFGTGYSSLQLINLYPIDTIKIDRSFVKDAISNKKNEAIIRAILHLANSLNLKIIAEGVETVEQYNFIKAMGCDEIQGYYFYKPCTSEIMETILKKRI